MIFTHLSVDLDAACSLWAARQFIPGMRDAVVAFVPANWDGEEMEAGDLALDIHAGGRGMKGEKEENGVIHSCFAAIVAKYASPADQAALSCLVAFVDAQDTHGSAMKFLASAASRQAQETLTATSLNAVLRAFQAMHPRNDAAACEKMSEVLSGMLRLERAKRGAAADEADQAEILPGGLVAIATNSREFATNGVLFDRGVRVVVYVDGHNLGIIRRGDEPLRMDHADLRAVVGAVGEMAEWFAHPAGFLFCRGSRKAPAASPSRVSPRALGEAVVKLLGARP